jgi:pantoate--beta-alanine ligase
MEIVNRVSRMSSLSAKLLTSELKWGLVSTRGGIHPGHMSLVQSARAMADLVIVSIFVDRLQFRTEEQYRQYPRDITKDVDLLRQENVDYVFTPPEEEIYPPDFSTYVQVEELGERLAGLPRDVMFRGMPTSTLKLIHIVRPTFVFLGQKDAIPAVILRKMIRDLNLSTEVIVSPVVRDDSGLAYAVCNQFLTENERAAAAVLYRSLQAAGALVAAGEHQAKKVAMELTRVIESEPLAHLEYAVVLKMETLEPLTKIQDKALIGVGVRIGAISLNDSLMAERAIKS